MLSTRFTELVAPLQSSRPAWVRWRSPGWPRRCPTPAAEIISEMVGEAETLLRRWVTGPSERMENIPPHES